MRNKISKDNLKTIVNGLYIQIVWIKLCIDEIDAMCEIGNDKLKIAKNFFYITHTSLIYRYSMELSKLFDDGNNRYSLRYIKNLCSANAEHFENSKDIIDCCRNLEKELKRYKRTTDNIHQRRNKTYAHNDESYYLFNNNAIQDFPLSSQEVKNLVEVIYIFANKVRKDIDPHIKKLEYPLYSDDVKHLFGMKTKAEIETEEMLEKIWSRNDKKDVR